MFLALLLLFGSNYFLWGNPFSTAYDNLIYFKAGEAFVSSDHVLSWGIFLSDWDKKLLTWPNGLLLTNPLLVLSLFGVFAAPMAIKKLVAFIWGVGFLNIMLIFSYSHWHSSSYGNRFLLAGLLMMVLPVVYLMGWGRSGK